LSSEFTQLKDSIKEDVAKLVEEQNNDKFTFKIRDKEIDDEGDILNPNDNQEDVSKAAKL
jgi:tRNA(Ser,Leu) C12 N-acetylase TAN1